MSLIQIKFTLNDDEVDLTDVYLYEEELIRKYWREKEHQRMRSENSFLIGGIRGADELIFISKYSSTKVSILHHDDVFLFKNFDEEIRKNQIGDKCDLHKLLQLLLKD